MVGVRRAGKNGAAVRWVPVNDKNRIVGEAHHSSKLTDADVTLILNLHRLGLSYPSIAQKFDDGTTVTPSMIGMICRGQRRCQTVMGYRSVALPSEFCDDVQPLQTDERDIQGGF